MPVTIFEPRSYLERVTDAWCFLPVFLPKAARETDPVERMKHVCSFAMSGLSNTCINRKPFNPILGETYQGAYSDGSEVYCEQTSHHPPITSWQVFGPEGLYHMYGYGELTASLRGNSARGQQEGTTVIDFQDGGQISYILPVAWVGGIFFGDRVIEYDGWLKLRDEKNKIGCDVLINPPQERSYWGWGPKKNPSDYFVGTLYRVQGDNWDDEASREVISKVDGSWLGCVQFDGKNYWDWQSNLPRSVPTPVDDPLPSDCRFREDVIYLAKGDIDSANQWKGKLEVKQRKEAKLRKEGKEKKKDELH